jgi:hypothetical protein
MGTGRGIWRLRNIVQSSLMIVVVSLLPVPICRGVGGDEQLTIRIMSGLLVLILVDRMRAAITESKEWPGFAREVGLIVGAPGGRPTGQHLMRPRLHSTQATMRMASSVSKSSARTRCAVPFR